MSTLQAVVESSELDSSHKHKLLLIVSSGEAKALYKTVKEFDS